MFITQIRNLLLGEFYHSPKTVDINSFSYFKRPFTNLKTLITFRYIFSVKERVAIS